MTVKVVTFGCRLNTYESELIKKYADGAGLENTVILNTCAVTSEAERQVRQTVRKLKRENPSLHLVVTGCGAQTNPESYSQMPEVSAVIGNKEKLQESTYVQLRKNIEDVVIVSDIMEHEETPGGWPVVAGFDQRVRGFVQIQNGCRHFCTFCIIPYGRGKSRSVPPEDVLKQVQLLVEAGYKELVLTGVDITDYGTDLDTTLRLGGLIKYILANISELERLRLSSVDVAEIDSDLLDLIGNEPRFMPHLHISAQAGDDMILKRMKRRHTRNQLIEFCNTVRILRPDVAFGADLIAGFPTETDEMFENTYRAIEECEIIHLHVFPYSERKGTPAARMPQVQPSIRKRRAKILRELGQELLTKRFSAKLESRKLSRLLIEGGGIARDEDYTKVKIESDALGKTVSAVLIGYEADHLLGAVL